MNTTTLVGNLTADPKLHVSDSGKKRATFSLAINEGQGENEKTHYVNLTAFDSLGENIAESFSKGMRVIVAARLNSYKQDVVINGEEKSITMLSYVATYAGPELRWALAKVTKVTREGNASGADSPATDNAATKPPAAAKSGASSPKESAPAESPISSDEDDF